VGYPSAEFYCVMLNEGVHDYRTEIGYHPVHKERWNTEQVNPTRMELIKKNAQIKLAEQGRDLLREKMDALIQEFFHIMVSVSKSREDLETIDYAAQRSLLVAQAVDDPVTLKSASFATKRVISLDIMNRRWVNALEQVLIPELKKQAKYIKIAIEEREREDLFRLKKVKKLLDRKKKAAKNHR
jgi:vacuolar-type H+-ATPase subunit D/Vma8